MERKTWSSLPDEKTPKRQLLMRESDTVASDVAPGRFVQGKTPARKGHLIGGLAHVQVKSGVGKLADKPGSVAHPLGCGAVIPLVFTLP